MASVIRTAKIFRIGGRRAIRLPADFETDGDKNVLKRDFDVITVAPTPARKGALRGRLKALGPFEPVAREQPGWTDRRTYRALRPMARKARRGCKRPGTPIDAPAVGRRLVSAITPAEPETTIAKPQDPDREFAKVREFSRVLQLDAANRLRQLDARQSAAGAYRLERTTTRGFRPIFAARRANLRSSNVSISPQCADAAW